MISAITSRRSEIGEAIQNRELSFYYQPQISLTTGQVDGAEALLRWERPNGSVVLPQEFLPHAEENNYITEISRHMFQRLLEDIPLIMDIGGDLSVSFNVSSRDFRTDTLFSEIKSAVDDHPAGLARLKIEITESSVMEDNLTVRRNFSELKELGIELMMDDYSQGFSSLDSLSRWAFSGIKIDKALLANAAHKQKYKTIIRNTIMMAYELGIQVVAEGVESESLYDLLLRNGCGYAQGFWFSQPLTLDDFIAFVDKGRRWTGSHSGLLHLAQIDHLQWRNGLVAWVIAKAFKGEDVGSGPLPELPNLSHRECRLGSWCDTLGEEMLGNYPEFKVLVQSHNRFHEIGVELCAAVNSGKSKDWLWRLMRLLTRESISMISLLQELEDISNTEPTLRCQKCG